jgi:transcriptional regulator with XRE-family HTH domain
VLRDEDIQNTGKAVAEELQRRREALGLSRNALAQKAGISVQSVSFIENGVNSPSLSTLLRICNALDTSLAHVLRRSGRKRPGVRTCG